MKYMILTTLALQMMKTTMMIKKATLAAVKKRRTRMRKSKIKLQIGLKITIKKGIFKKALRSRKKLEIFKSNL
jgi:hypothetical protein